jgi:DNA repair exonuclease SbcCD ATPase subunit
MIKGIIFHTIIQFGQTIQELRNDMYYPIPDDESQQLLLTTMITTLKATIENSSHALVSGSQTVPVSRYANLKDAYAQKMQEIRDLDAEHEKLAHKYKRLADKYEKSKKKIDRLTKQLADLEYDNASESSSIKYLTGQN